VEEAEEKPLLAEEEAGEPLVEEVEELLPVVVAVDGQVVEVEVMSQTRWAVEMLERQY
jgi:hypothetical protein